MTRPVGAAHVIAAIRWDDEHGFALERDDALALARAGIGGVFLQGGPVDAVAGLVEALRAAAPHPLLVATDAERGAGQRFAGATGLPPLGALAAAGDLDAVRLAARVTARELRAVGVTWAMAPVVDLDAGADNPIVGSRAAGAAAEPAATVVSEWIDAAQAEGVLACAKHFPGLGRASGDPHRAPVTIAAPAHALAGTDLAVFSTAIDAGVASVLVGHAAYPALDAAGAPASQSRAIITNLLRGRLGFDGLVVSDAVAMDAAVAPWGGDEARAAVRALAAGCDVVLWPDDPWRVAQAIEAAWRDGTLDSDASRAAADRRTDWAVRAAPGAVRPLTLGELTRAKGLGDAAVHQVRGRALPLGDSIELITVDDDDAHPLPSPDRRWFAQALAFAGRTVVPVATPSADRRDPVLVAAYADIRPWKGHAAFTSAARLQVRGALEAAARMYRPALVVLFGHPRRAAELPEATDLLCAWGGDRAMQEAAARRVLAA